MAGQLEAKIKYNRVLELLEFGTSKYEVLKGKQPFDRLTVPEACKEAGANINSFNVYLKTHEAFARKYHEMREINREVIRNHAESNLEKILSGELAVENKDLGDLSLKVLKATDKNYNQKVETETTLKASLDMTSEEILARIEELKG